MNDDMWIRVVDEKQAEIDYLRQLLIRLKELMSRGRHCCYCGTENPHAKACDEAMGVIKGMKK
jgi:hypothetical protein